MSTAAFSTAAALPSPRSGLRKLPARSAPRMTVAVPRPAGPPGPAALYARAQERREGFFGPSFTSDLSSAATSIRPGFAALALRTLLCNAHVFEPEASVLAPVVARFQSSRDAREFAREVAKSGPFRARFFDPVSNSRFVELAYKLLLARPPRSQAETASALAVLEGEGYDALVDALLDSREYAARFGNVVVPAMTAAGEYDGGMPAFSAQMRLQLPTRGANSDVTCSTSRTVGVLGGGNPAGCVEIREAYDVSVPRYVPDFGWMELPRSSLLKDWASMTLVLSNAAENWSGLGTPRATGEADGDWEDGWKPTPTGEEWSPGWTGPKQYKTYV